MSISSPRLVCVSYDKRRALNLYYRTVRPVDTNLAMGWYPDPQDPSRERFWDGNGWVDATRRDLLSTSPSTLSSQVAAVKDPSKSPMLRMRIAVALLVGLGVTIAAVWGFNALRSSDGASFDLCVEGEHWCIGDTGPGGGIVYITPSTPGNTTGSYYEVARFADVKVAPWCDVISAITGASGTAIGTGKSNTATADEFCTYGAIQIAADYVNNGKTDWFLPSKEELDPMYTNRHALDGYITDHYWSSSEYNALIAWSQYFGFNAGTQANLGKSSPNRVRPVRSFS